MRAGDLHREGLPIVLTASRAEMSDFGLNPFLAFYNTFPHRLARRCVQGFFSPNPGEDGQERFAPYGLRKVEALLAAEFGQENVAVAHPDTLDRFIGPRTRLLGISTVKLAEQIGDTDSAALARILGILRAAGIPGGK